MRSGSRLFRSFGAKQIAALLLSVLLSILVVIILSRFRNFEALGYAGGFLAMLLGSATVVLPAPGLAVVAALGTSLSSPLLLGLVAGIGATIGETTGFLAGYGGRNIVADKKGYQKTAQFIEKHGFLAIFILSLIPNPFFDIAGIFAGATKYPFGLFLLATLLGKVVKCTAVAYLGHALPTLLIS